MAPRRSGRRTASPYKKGDYIEFQYKGGTVTGKLVKKSTKGTAAKPIWVVTPSDRRRKNEEIPEDALGKVIDAQEAMNNRGPKLKKGSGNGNGNGNNNDDKPNARGGSVASPTSSGTSTNSNSDGSLEDQQAAVAAPKQKRGIKGGGSPSFNRDNTSKAGSSASRKRKGDESNMNNENEVANKKQKTVTFSMSSTNKNKSDNNTASANPKKKSNKPINNKVKKVQQTAVQSTRIGTRSTGVLMGEQPMLLPDFPLRMKKAFKAANKRVKKDENVKIIQMLTGTLYLYRGDRPRAEFIRSK